MNNERPRRFSWVLLALTLCISLGLSASITNSTKELLLTKQTDSALLLADNLNHQIYRRFTLPTMLTFKRIALKQPVVYERLDQVVLSVIHGWEIKNLRIYDANSTVVYSVDKDELGNKSLDSSSISKIQNGGKPEFEIISDIPMWKALFLVTTLKPNSFVLRTTYPLRVEGKTDSDEKDNEEETSPLMGVLEFYQDTTEDFKTILAFQWQIVGTIMFAVVALFAVFRFYFVRRILGSSPDEGGGA